MKRIKGFLVILITIFLLSGCVKNSITTKVNSDKSMNLEIEVLTKEEYKDKLSSIVTSMNLENRGFKLSTVSNDSYSGYKITRTFKSIDDLSNGSKDTVDISYILEEQFDFSRLFVRKSSFFKDTYTANLTYSAEKLKSIYVFNGSGSDEELEELELKYVLVIPTKAGNNDADEISTDKKYLTWKLSTDKEEKINYTFDIINIMHIALVGGGALLLLIVIIIVIVVIKKKNASKASLVYKEYDESIEGKLDKSEVIEGDAPKAEATVVQTGELPEQVNVPVEQKIDEPKVEEPQLVAPIIDGPEEPAAPAVETAVDNMEMQQLPSLEFEVPDNLIEQQEEVKEEPLADFKPNTFDYNRRPEFVKSTEPSKFVDEKVAIENAQEIEEPAGLEAPVLEEQKVTPTAVPVPETPIEMQTDNQTFIHTYETPTPTGEVQNKPNEVELDVPNGIALSDMDQNK